MGLIGSLHYAALLFLNDALPYELIIIMNRILFRIVPSCKIGCQFKCKVNVCSVTFLVSGHNMSKNNPNSLLLKNSKNRFFDISNPRECVYKVSKESSVKCVTVRKWYKNFVLFVR